MASLIDRPMEQEQLPPDRCVRFVRKLVKRQGQFFGGTMKGQVQKAGFHFQESPPLNFNVGVPARIQLAGARSAPAPIADGIPMHGGSGVKARESIRVAKMA